MKKRGIVDHCTAELGWISWSKYVVQQIPLGEVCFVDTQSGKLDYLQNRGAAFSMLGSAVVVAVITGRWQVPFSIINTWRILWMVWTDFDVAGSGQLYRQNESKVLWLKRLTKNRQRTRCAS